jgi:hypothetical protein
LRDALAAADESAVVTLALPRGFTGDPDMATFYNVEVSDGGSIFRIRIRNGPRQ